MIHGFNDSTKEKVGVQTITKTQSIPANIVTEVTWNRRDLLDAGVDADNLEKYAILDVQKAYGEGSAIMWYLYGGKPVNDVKVYPEVKIDTFSDKIVITDYVAQTATITYKIRLLKVE